MSIQNNDEVRIYLPRLSIILIQPQRKLCVFHIECYYYDIIRSYRDFQGSNQIQLAELSRIYVDLFLILKLRQPVMYWQSFMHSKIS